MGQKKKIKRRGQQVQVSRAPLNDHHISRLDPVEKLPTSWSWSLKNLNPSVLINEPENTFFLFFLLFLNLKLMYTLSYHSNCDFKDEKRQNKSQRGSAMKSSPIGLLKRGLRGWLVQSAFNPFKPLTSIFWGSSCLSPSSTVWNLTAKITKSSWP